uniref:SCY1 like pseudokinase 3 n=1 Tax=Leptobrachium leishanense TaxID=445787 RepID=A0A8C5QMS7_9ANUR
MGSESSSLRGFTLQDPPWTQPSGLTIYPANLADGRLASVFVYQPENQDKVDKAAKHLKTLRHPCLLRFLSCTVEEDGIYLVTERVQPLEILIQKLSTDEICSGIYDILQALVFLHERGKVSHNNVCLSSLFVSEDGHWKLGGMEMVCKLTEVTPESAEFGLLPISLSHARDAFSFGRLVESLLAHVKDQNDALSDFKNTVKKSLLNPEPELRPALSALLSHDFFRNDFLEVVNFLESLTVKTEDEKNEFFKVLLGRVSSLSEELISSRLVSLLLNQLVFAEPAAVKCFLPHLLKPKRDIMGRNREGCLLSPPLFQTRVIPVLMKMFEVHEEHVRVVLLTHIDAYGELFTLKELKDIILPQVLLGLRDTSDLLVSVTLRGLAALVCLLGPEVVVGGGRVKIFKSTAPGFTKTTDITPEGEILSLAPPVNGITPFQSTLANCNNHGNKSTEDWPDWNEPDMGGSEKHMQLPVKSTNPEIQKYVNTEPWDDFGSSNEVTEREATNNLNIAHLDTDNPSTSHFNSLSGLDVKLNSKVNNTQKTIKETNKLSLLSRKAPHEKAPEKKLVSGFGLGEEFTIKVTKKSRDPELDWFADMTPEIKSSSVLFNVSKFGAETVPEDREKISSEFPNMDLPNSNTPGFSSKFAAAEVTEVEADGWGEENDFSWEEDSTN